MNCQEVIARLKALGNPVNVAGMARFGINSENTLGISVATLRGIAKEIGKDHQLALDLWDSGIHEARILAVLIDNPKLVTEEQLEVWVRDFDSWDVCDLCCMHLFRKTGLAHQKATQWCTHQETFVKRAGFVMMATLAVHDKKAADEVFAAYLKLIQAAATDERNFVKKAVNWALRQIGKRNRTLNQEALKVANAIVNMDSKAARWIARDAIRELAGAAVQQRFSV